MIRRRNICFNRMGFDLENLSSLRGISKARLSLRYGLPAVKVMSTVCSPAAPLPTHQTTTPLHGRPSGIGALSANGPPRDVKPCGGKCLAPWEASQGQAPSPSFKELPLSLDILLPAKSGISIQGHAFRSDFREQGVKGTDRTDCNGCNGNLCLLCCVLQLNEWACHVPFYPYARGKFIGLLKFPSERIGSQV